MNKERVRSPYWRKLHAASLLGATSLQDAASELIMEAETWDEVQLLKSAIESVGVGEFSRPRAVWVKVGDCWHLRPSVDCRSSIARLSWDELRASWTAHLHEIRLRSERPGRPHGEMGEQDAKDWVVARLKDHAWPASWMPSGDGLHGDQDLPEGGR